jgi:hypothetical protein
VKTEVNFDMLNFVNIVFLAAVMDMEARKPVEKPELRSIFLPVFALIQALLTAPLSIE